MPTPTSRHRELAEDVLCDGPSCGDTNPVIPRHCASCTLTAQPEKRDAVTALLARVEEEATHPLRVGLAFIRDHTGDMYPARVAEAVLAGRSIEDVEP